MSFDMGSFLRRHKVEIVIFAAAFLLRALYAILVEITSGAHGFISHADAELFYHLSAVNLLEHGAFSVAQTAPFYPDAYHTPLYSIVIAFLLALRAPLLVVVLLQSLINAGTCVLVYRIGLELSRSQSIAIVAVILAIVEPMSLYWGGLIMSDTLFAFLVTLSYLLLMREYAATSFFVLGLAALTRPIAIFFAPFFLCMLLYQLYLKKTKKADTFKEAALVVIVMILTVSPWLIRNMIVFNSFALTSAGWYELYVAPLQEFARDKGIPIPDEKIAPIEKDIRRFDFRYSALYKEAFVSVVSQDPIGYVLTHIKRSLYSLVSNRYDYLIHIVIKSQLPSVFSRFEPVLTYFLSMGAVFWLSIYALCIAAFFEKKTRHWWLFFLALVGTNALLSGGINPGGSDMSRYMLAFHALYFVFAGIGYQFLRKLLRL